ncbi:MAG: right-handed parallel beta-helix repeat-containing protein [Planctomycetes bacterium]|nr:right-handed parallel beta-helix repeat-containing protein [Planctomycetota bacterium]
MTAALHIQGTHDVSVERLWFRSPPETLSSTAILIEDSPRVVVRNNKITDLEYGIIIQRGDYAEIIGNRIQNIDTHGIVVINGQHTRIVGNEIKEAGAFGIWACDYDGECLYNTLSKNFIGMVLCRVNEGSFEISGKLDGANSSANGWRVALNESTDSFIGYAVDDGAFNNYLFGNGASGNDLYDIDFWFDTHDNVLVQGPVNDPLLIHLCGTNNRTRGDFTLSDDSCDM